MAQKRLSPSTERKEHLHAWETYRDLGYGRSYRQVARLENRNVSTVARWAKIFGWTDRLLEHSKFVAIRQREGAILKIDDPIANKLTDVMDKVEAVIDSAFHKNAVGGLEPMVKVKTIDELSKFIAEYRRMLETYHRFVEEHMPGDKARKRGAHIDEFNVYLGKLSQADRIEALKGTPNGTKPGGDSKPEGRVQEADFTEVSGSGDEDRP